MPSRFPCRPAPALAAFASFILVVLAVAAQAAPLPPTNLRGSFNSSASITIVWDDLTGDQTGFEVDYIDAGGPHLLGTFPATGTSTNFSLTNLTVTAGVTYTFVVRAYSGATTNASAFINTVMTPGALAKPTATLIAPQSDGSFRLMWTDNATAETGYSLEFSTTSSSGPWTVLGTTDASVITVGSGSLNPGTTYYFRMRPFLNTTFGPYCDVPVSAKTGTTLNAPTGLTATPLSPRRLP